MSIKKIFGKNKDNPMDYKMLSIICILVAFGLITLASASSYYALSGYGDSNYLWIRQLIFAVIGIVTMFVVSNIDYRIYKKFAYIGFGVTTVLMALVLVPGIGVSAGGATRWLGVGSLTFQPSEIMKTMLVLACATYIVLNLKKMVDIKRIKDVVAYLPIMLMLIIVMVIMYFQDHLSGTMVMIVAIGAILFTTGIKVSMKYIIVILLIGAIGISVFIFGDMISFEDGEMVFGESYRLTRITAFLNPEEDLQGSNWQAAQSLYAIGTGGVFGLGIGQSRQKYLWLPEAQNDFIFSVLAEELGLIGSICTIGLFMFFIYRGLYIAMKCNDLYGTLIASGITMVYAFQIIVNIAVVTCSMPVTGMPLPFFSYGGTALLINLATMGILLNISRNIRSQ